MSSRRKIFSLAVAAMAAQGAVGGALLHPLWAQETTGLGDPVPELQAVRAANEAQAQELWKQLQERSADLEATAPRAAIARHQEFFEAGAGRFPSVGVQVSLRIASLWQLDGANYDKAIEIYEWAIGLYSRNPNLAASVAQLQKGRLAALQAKAAKQKDALSKSGAPSSPAVGVPNLTLGIPGTAAGGTLGIPGTVGGGTLGLNIAPPSGAIPKMPGAATASALPANPLGSSDGPATLLSLVPPAPPGTALGWRPGPNRCVTALAQGAGGVFWVATEDAGVWKCDPAAPSLSRWQQFTTKDGLGDDTAYALAVDKQNRVWAGTLNHGVSVWNGKQWKNYSVLDGPLGERVFAIKVCPTDGDVWIATNAGLSRYSIKNDRWNTVTGLQGLSQVQALAFDQSGNLLVGTQCDGVAVGLAAQDYSSWRMVKGAEQMPTTPTGTGLPSSLINDVLVARDGTFYVGTTMGLAWSRDTGKSWSYVRGQDYAAKVRGLVGGAPRTWMEKPGAVLAEDYVSCLAQDEAGRLWVGHWRAGDEVLEMQDGPIGGVKRVVNRESSGFVKAILPLPNAVPLVARYDEGVSTSVLVTVNTNAPRQKEKLVATPPQQLQVHLP